LVAAGSFKLENTCVSMLAGSNQHFLKEVYNKNAVYGGLLARTVLVVAHKLDRPRNSLVFLEPKERPKGLTDHLRTVAKLKGRMIMDHEAAEHYDEWYNANCGELDPNDTGILNRVHTTMLKVAMCLAAAEPEPQLVMKKKHVAEAIDLCVALIPNYEFITTGQSSSVSAKLAPQVMRELVLSYAKGIVMVGRKNLVRKFVGQIDLRQMDDILKNLVDAGYVEVKADSKGEPHYRLTPSAIEKIGQKGKE
jgi:hypothetical protein